MIGDDTAAFAKQTTQSLMHVSGVAKDQRIAEGACDVLLDEFVHRSEIAKESSRHSVMR